MEWQVVFLPVKEEKFKSLTKNNYNFSFVFTFPIKKQEVSETITYVFLNYRRRTKQPMKANQQKLFFTVGSIMSWKNSNQSLSNLKKFHLLACPSYALWYVFLSRHFFILFSLFFYHRVYRLALFAQKCLENIFFIYSVR